MNSAQRERMKKFFQANKDRYAYYTADYRDAIRQEMIEAYGSKCQWCGETDPIVLTLDHIHDDSQVEKDLYGVNARGGHKNYSRLKKEGWPKDRFQLLCQNCNTRKEFTRRRDAMVERWGSREEIFNRPKRAGEGVRINNKSGFKGVFWNSQKARWAAKITVDGMNRNLGFFINIRDAAIAYRTAAIAAWGDLANVPTDEEIDEIADRIQPGATPEELGL